MVPLLKTGADLKVLTILFCGSYRLLTFLSNNSFCFSISVICSRVIPNHSSIQAKQSLWNSKRTAFWLCQVKGFHQWYSKGRDEVIDLAKGNKNLTQQWNQMFLVYIVLGFLSHKCAVVQYSFSLLIMNTCSIFLSQHCEKWFYKINLWVS